MKRILPFLLCLMLAGLLSGCVNQPAETSSPEPTPTWLVLPDVE